MRRYEVNVETPLDEVLDLASRYIAVRRALVDALSGPSRLKREYASQALNDLAHKDLSLVEEFSDAFVDALFRPEAPTRYNSLAVIGMLSEGNMRLIDKAWDGIEDCLYDEESGTVCLAAFKVLASYGSTTAARSLKAWPLISDAVRCYHGDPEFIPMLNELIAMLHGTVDLSVMEEARDLFEFNAGNASGLLKRKSQDIVDFTNQHLPPKPEKEEDSDTEAADSEPDDEEEDE